MEQLLNEIFQKLNMVVFLFKIIFTIGWALIILFIIVINRLNKIVTIIDSKN